MEKAIQPTKQRVRQWLIERRTHAKPLPSIEQIRIELGWKASAVKAQDAGACRFEDVHEGRSSLPDPA